MVKNPDGTWTDASVGTLGALAEGGRATDWKTNTNINLSTKIDVIKDVFLYRALLLLQIPRPEVTGITCLSLIAMDPSCLS